MNNELEATFLAINKDLVRAKLQDTGFTLKTPEYLMKRKTFDFSHIAPGRNKWGRVRQEFDQVTMTVKEICGDGIGNTYEVEVVVNDFNAACAFFEACNIPVKSYQENRREVWVRGGVVVTIDTWPGINPFVEVEGENEKIVRDISEELGFDFQKAVYGSIDLVYEKELGIPTETLTRLPEITFINPPKKKRRVSL